MMIEAVKLMARTEAILLDPVYTGKVVAGMIGLARSSYFGPKDKVLFIHTGGAPSLSAYESVLLASDGEPGKVSASRNPASFKKFELAIDMFLL
jgi:D-cysteine desulfhydrase